MKKPNKQNRHIGRIRFVQIPWVTINHAGRLTPSEFQVLCTLYSFNPSYPSHAQICELSGLTKNTVNTALKGLKDKNVVTWSKGHGYGKNNVYWINEPNQWSKDPDETSPQILRRYHPKFCGSNNTKNKTNIELFEFDPINHPEDEYYSSETIMNYLKDSEAYKAEYDDFRYGYAEYIYDLDYSDLKIEPLVWPRKAKVG